MKKQILAGFVLFTFCCVVSVSAQKNDETKQKKKPNFSGVWVYDEAKSNTALKEIYKTSKKPTDSIKRQTNKFIIEHSGNELKVTETVSVETFDENGKIVDKSENILSTKIYYTDKRGERNIGGNNQSVESFTQWNDKKIVVTVLVKNKEHQSTITFSLSKKGQELRVIYLVFKSGSGVVSPSIFGDRVFNKIN